MRDIRWQAVSRRADFMAVTSLYAHFGGLYYTVGLAIGEGQEVRKHVTFSFKKALKAYNFVGGMFFEADHLPTVRSMNMVWNTTYQEGAEEF